MWRLLEKKLYTGNSFFAGTGDIFRQIIFPLKFVSDNAA